ncbi:13296_t:CDS:10 [Entrophospora sp. SA101]|nr:13296_t:CDS:10 [Entrophospora sp. SA101]
MSDPQNKLFGRPFSDVDNDSDVEDLENEDELEYNYEEDLLVVNDIMILDDAVFADENDNINNEIDEPSIQYSTVKLDSQPFPVLNITLPSHVTIDCKFYTKDDDTLTFLADFSANLELFNDGSYKFTPTENMINSSGLLLLSWNNIPGNGISVIGFCEELVDIKNNYPGQANLQNYIDYLQYNFVYIQENKKNYLIRDWTNYLGFPNHHISLRIPEPIASAPIVGYNRTTVSIVPYGYTNRYFETVETEKRFETVLSNVGPLGGTISILLGIYAIYLLLKNLPVIPLTEKTHLHYERSKDPNISEIEDPNISEIKKDLASLTTRFHSLETILREYVINSDFLDELETGKTSNLAQSQR